MLFCIVSLSFDFKIYFYKLSRVSFYSKNLLVWEIQKSKSSTDRGKVELPYQIKEPINTKYKSPSFSKSNLLQYINNRVIKKKQHVEIDLNNNKNLTKNHIMSFRNRTMQPGISLCPNMINEGFQG